MASIKSYDETMPFKNRDSFFLIVLNTIPIRLIISLLGSIRSALNKIILEIGSKNKWQLIKKRLLSIRKRTSSMDNKRFLSVGRLIFHVTFDTFITSFVYQIVYLKRPFISTVISQVSFRYLLNFGYEQKKDAHCNLQVVYGARYLLMFPVTNYFTDCYTIQLLSR